MREMKSSGVEWIGCIPQSWRITKIKYFYDCYDGRRVPVDAALRSSGPYPYWGAGSITDYVDKYLFDEELVLLGEDGAPFFDYTRPVAFLINEKVWVNNHIHVLKPKEPLNKSAAALSGSFAPTFRFENLEIHKVFLQFSNLNLEQNPSLTALAI